MTKSSGGRASAPTYKRAKGFQPLQVTWDRFIIDAVFRGGDKHCNHADTVEKTLLHLVEQIRKRYRSEVPIIVRLDSGLLDQKLLKVFGSLGIGYIVAGKLYQDIQQFISQQQESAWKTYQNRDRKRFRLSVLLPTPPFTTRCWWPFFFTSALRRMSVIRWSR